VADVAVLVVPTRSLALLAEVAGVAQLDVPLPHPIRLSSPACSRNIVRIVRVRHNVRVGPACGAVSDVAVPMVPMRTLALFGQPALIARSYVALAHPVRRTAPKTSRNVERVLCVGGVRCDPSRRSMADVAVSVGTVIALALVAEPAAVAALNVSAALPV